MSNHSFINTAPDAVQCLPSPPTSPDAKRCVQSHQVRGPRGVAVRGLEVPLKRSHPPKDDARRIKKSRPISVVSGCPHTWDRMACSRLPHGLPPLSVQPTGAQCLTTPLRPNKPTVLVIQVSTEFMLPLFRLMCLLLGTT
ncbi:hypothetical protein E2C01_102799 [Portunus trituberculatus]|uniref:Uncharacterized protein n=1 Tax=Portunus trituberculatus TaxID=210409 RepID=A0A5B7KI71_PORTR|nr:hypothetical protein [Portunus trituberculatus]